VEKLADEGYARAFNESFQMSNVCFRFFNVFGPRQLPDHEYAAVLPKFLASAHAGEALTIHGTGSQYRDFVYVEDVARLLVATATTGLIAEELVYNLAFGDVHSIRDIAEMALSITKSQSELLFSEPRPGDITTSEADGNRLRRLFPSFEPTPFASAVAATSTWLHDALRAKR
jgi:UDP-glucose 4-epimerase